MTTVKSGLTRVARRYPRAVPGRLLRSLSSSSPTARAFALEIALTTSRPTSRNRAVIDDLARGLPTRDLVSALTAGRSSLTRTRLDALSSIATEPILGLDFATAFLERRFVDAYEIWRQIPDVAMALAALPTPDPSTLTRSMAVVLPGPTDSSLGDDIDHHDLVARTGTTAPTRTDAASIGSRFDVAFLNVPRYRELGDSHVPLPIDADRIVTDPSCRSDSRPPWLDVPVEFDLAEVETPSAPHSYITMRIVPWCHARGFRPTLYFADFYLSQAPYQSADYDPSHRLEEGNVIIRYYLTHDVFFTHAALQKWRSHGAIHTCGRLDELLSLDGHSFAQAIQDRWATHHVTEDL